VWTHVTKIIKKEKKKEKEKETIGDPSKDPRHWTQNHQCPFLFHIYAPLGEIVRRKWENVRRKA
jgi:hypothetical protein